MRAYGKDWSYNVYSCVYCLYWKGRKSGCTYGADCCCPVPQRPPVRNGNYIHYPKKERTRVRTPVSECEACPYGKAAPCIGWCTKEIMTAEKNERVA